MSLEYKKFRVRTPIKSFRDLDVYKNTTLLSAEIFKLKLPEKYRKSEKLRTEMSTFYNLSKIIPLFIAESHSQKFSNLKGALLKLEKTAQIVNVVITKIDFLGAVVDDVDFKNTLLDLIKNYQINKRKILNLKKAWDRVFNGNFKPSRFAKYPPKADQPLAENLNDKK